MLRKHRHVLIIFFLYLLISGCKKEEVLPPFNESFTEPYTTGSIRFQFYRINPDNPGTPTKMQQTDFTGLYERPEERWMCGYYRPDFRWTAMLRINPANYYQRASILFYDVNIDSLPLPFTFYRNQNFNTQMEYTLGFKQYFDSTGAVIASFDSFGATTNYDDFTLTLFSKSNNRLQGTFSGTIKHVFEDDQIKIEKGIFDVGYVVR